MIGFYQSASRFCGMGALFCVMLALLVGQSAKADDPMTCESCCTAKGYTGYQYQQCMQNCELGQGECAGLVRCGAKHANGCTAMEESTCKTQGTSCATIHGGVCGCRWGSPATPPQPDHCGCFPD
jgi:hypothetical protein